MNLLIRVMLILSLLMGGRPLQLSLLEFTAPLLLSPFVRVSLWVTSALSERGLWRD